MGVLIDYFAAPSDAEAAATIDSVGGPGKPPSAESPRRGLFARKVKGAEAVQPQGFRTVSDTGIDPVVQAGTLEALLTGRTFDEVFDAAPSVPPVAIRDEGERVVLKVSDGLVDALVRSTPESLAEVAVPWSETEEFWGQGDAQALAGLLNELAELARYARSQGQALYAWVCV